VRTVSKVFNLTTGERYTIADQNVDDTGDLNTTGRIQISGSTLPSVTDVLQVNYTWARQYDPNLDFDSLTSLLSTQTYNNQVNDSVDWGFGNIVIEEDITVAVSGETRTVTTTYDVSRVVSVKEGDYEIYDVADNDGAGFSGNVITLPTSAYTVGTVDVEYVANLTSLIPSTSLSSLPLERSGNGFSGITGNQPITTDDNVLTSDIQYAGEILPEDNLNPWSFFTFSGTTALSAAIIHLTATQTVLSLSVSGAAGYYFRTESILSDSSTVDFTTSMRIPITTSASWNSDVGFYIDDGTYQVRFVFFTDALGNRKIGLRNSFAAATYSADATIDFTGFHTYRVVKNGTTNVQLYIDGTLAITALYNVNNFFTSEYPGTVAFGNFGTTTPSSSQWDYVNYTVSTTSDVEKLLRYGPTQIKYTLSDIPASGTLTTNGATMHKVESSLVSTSNYALEVDLSRWSGLTSTQLADVNYKLAKVESIQKIGSDGSVLVDYDLAGEVPDIERRYNFNVLPTAEDNPWTKQFDVSSEATESIVSSNLVFQTSGASSSGNSIYFRTEDHFRVGQIMTATFRMMISSYTFEQIGSSTLNDTGVGVWIQNPDVVIPVAFVGIGTTQKYIAIVKDTSQVSDITDAYVLYPVDWTQYHIYEFSVDREGNISVGIDGAPAVSVPYISQQYLSKGGISDFGITNEAIMFGHGDNRGTITYWDYFYYESTNADDAKYELYDNFYDLRLADENTSLDRFKFNLPDTTTNSSSISVGNTIKTVFYYVRENNAENIKITTDGTYYTNNRFALIDKVYISSGFANSAGFVSGSFVADSSTQVGANSTYKVDYSFTAPKQGERITVEYRYNKLIGDLTELLEDNRVVTSDILIREATSIGVDVTVDVVPESGFNLSLVTLQQNVQNSIIDLLTSEEMGTIVDSSDIIDVVYNNTGVDKVTLLTFNLSGSTGVRSTITAEGNEYVASGTITVNIKDRSGSSLL
jgi:hypothetical protein